MPERQRGCLTQHLADVGFNVNVLQMLVCVGMVETQRAVQSYGHPHTIAHPAQLTHLALLAWVGIKTCLQHTWRNGSYEIRCNVFNTNAGIIRQHSSHLSKTDLFSISTTEMSRLRQSQDKINQLATQL